MIYFSASTCGFYDEVIHGARTNSVPDPNWVRPDDQPDMEHPLISVPNPQSVIPTDALAISEQQHAVLMAGQSAGQCIVADENGLPVLVEPQPPVTPPVMAVTMRQARLALLAAGKLGQIDAAIDGLPSPQKEEARIEWEYSQEVQRNKPLVLSLAPALGLDDAALDALFLAASQL